MAKVKEKVVVTGTRGTVIQPCTCAHVYQDARYGKGKRVFTPGNKSNYCTVCSREIPR